MLGTVLHSALLVPYASWRSSHAGHHRHTCSVEHDEAFAPRVLAPGAEVRPLTWPCAPCLRVVASASTLGGGWWSAWWQCPACLVHACAFAVDLARGLPDLSFPRTCCRFGKVRTNLAAWWCGMVRARGTSQAIAESPLWSALLVFNFLFFGWCARRVPPCSRVVHPAPNALTQRGARCVRAGRPRQ